jgi:hypothetical protein
MSVYTDTMPKARFQLMLEPAQLDALRQVERDTGVPVSKQIRQAIDRVLAFLEPAPPSKPGGVEVRPPNRSSVQGQPRRDFQRETTPAGELRFSKARQVGRK